jgi:hypothetical protein
MLPAFSEVFPAPKTEIAHAGRAEWRGGPLTAPLALLYSRNADVKKFVRFSFRTKITMPQSPETESFGDARDLV